MKDTLKVLKKFSVNIKGKEVTYKRNTLLATKVFIDLVGIDKVKELLDNKILQEELQ